MRQNGDSNSTGGRVRAFLRLAALRGSRSCRSRSVTRTPPPNQCVIALWRGYGASRFYAYQEDREEVFCLSPTFRTWSLPWQQCELMHKDPPVVAALADLEAELLERGWERMRRASGSKWYELRFRRPQSGEGFLGRPAAQASKRKSGSHLQGVRSGAITSGNYDAEPARSG